MAAIAWAGKAPSSCVAGGSAFSIAAARAADAAALVAPVPYDAHARLCPFPRIPCGAVKGRQDCVEPRRSSDSRMEQEPGDSLRCWELFHSSVFQYA